MAKSVNNKGYDLSIEEVRAVIDSMVDIAYTCLINGIRVTIPNLGEFYRDIKKGRKAGYYNVPSSRDAHTEYNTNYGGSDPIWYGLKNIKNKLPIGVKLLSWHFLELLNNLEKKLRVKYNG